MPAAWSLIRSAPWYRARAFADGLKAAGFELRTDQPRGAPGNVLVIWNRYGGWHVAAEKFEREGGRVIVAENGYLGRGGTSPKFSLKAGVEREQYFSLSWGWHNGRGIWPSGGPERFAALGVELKRWRADGSHVLVCPNRSFGVGAQVMPPDWAQRVAERLRRETRREVRIRVHPGNDAPRRPLSEDLRGAWAVCVWSSSVAVHALLEGIPTYIEAPWQVVKGAGASGPIEAPETPERRPHFERMAWHQWTGEEIESGEPFRRLLSAAG